MTDPARRARTIRALLVSGTALALVTALAVVHPWSTSPSPDPSPPTRSLFVGDGQLAEALPALASDITLADNEDGSLQLSFEIDYDVTNPGSSPFARLARTGAAKRLDSDGTAPATSATTSTSGTTSTAGTASDSSDASTSDASAADASTADDGSALPDAAVVTVQVAEAQAPGGPIRLAPMFRQTVVDEQLTDELTRSAYSVRLPPAVAAFLEAQGLGTDDPDAHRAALRFVDIDIQQMRDFSQVDGRWDWQQGRAYTAADQPVRAAITDDSTITVTNNTDAGVYGPPNLSVDPSDPTELSVQFLDGDQYATNLTLSGQAVECIDQGDGSNPQGFAMLNGWDIADGLPPGTVPPGASVTQQVNANESLGTSSLDVAQNTTAATVQVLAAVGDYATGGIKDAASTALLLAMGIEEFSAPVTVALGVPIMAILGLVDGIYQAMTNSCASFANVFNLTAAEPLGAQSSYSWGDQTDGLWDIYDSASFGGSPVTNNVAVAPSNGIMSVTDDGGPATFHPYLAQQATQACGTGCSDENNVIELNWSLANPCPFSDVTDCTPAPSQLSGLPEVDVPGTSLCGTDNALCPPVAAPNADASEVIGYDPSSLDELSAYEVVAEDQPPTTVTGIAVTDDTTVYAAGQDGALYRYQPEGAFAEVLSSENAITALVEYQGSLVLAAGDAVLAWDPATGALSELVAVGAPIERMVEVGGLVYLLAADALWALESDWSVGAVSVAWPAGVEALSVAASASYLVVGFQDGWVYRCELADCGATWAELHDGGFDSDANALTAVGDTVYVGLENGAVFQLDPDTLAVATVAGPGTDGKSIGGLATVDGNVYVGGCIGQQSPVSGDMLGVVAVVGIDAEGGFVGSPDAPYGDSCQNPTESTTKYKGFDPSTYQIVPTPATSSHPPLVFVAFSISSGNFFYVLESVAPFTDALCLPTVGNCPGPPAAPPPPPTVPAPVGTVTDLADPQVVSTCGLPPMPFTPATADAPLTTSSGATITDGFALTAPTSGAGCTTTWAWNTNLSGTYPYLLWQANAYAAAPPDGTTLGVLGALQAPLEYAVDGVQATAGDTTSVPIGGAQLAVDLRSATVLVLEVTTPAGASGPVQLAVTNDVLTSTGQDIPAPTPLEGQAAPTPACAVHDPALAGLATALYPMDDTSLLVRDVSGNAHNALATAPAAFDVTPGPFSPCPDAGALRFDGATSSVALPTTVNTTLEGDALTVSAWVNVAEPPAGTNPRVLANGHADDADAGPPVGVELFLNGSGGASFAVGNGTFGATASTTQALGPGTWHQLTGVYDAPALTLYLDGQPVGSSTLRDGGAVASGTAQAALGYDPMYDGDHFAGLMADVVLVPQALTAEQVAASYSAVADPGPAPSTTTTTVAPSSTTSAPTSTTTATSAPSTSSGGSSTSTTAVPSSSTATTAPPACSSNSPLASQAAALWLLDDRSTTAVDASGNGMDATITAAAAYDQVPGPVARCPNAGGLAFDGTATVVTAPAALSPATTGSALTVVSWFQAASAITGQPRVLANDRPTSSGAGVALWLDASGGSGVVGGSVDVGTAAGTSSATWSRPVTPLAWHQYVGVYDGTTVTAYLDGVAVGSAPASGAIRAGGFPVTLGVDPAQQTDRFTGLLADVAVVPTALTATQVQALWAATQPVPAAAATGTDGATGATSSSLVPGGFAVLVAALAAAATRRRSRSVSP